MEEELVVNSMKRIKNVGVACLSALMVVGCASTANPEKLALQGVEPNIRNIQAHMHFLADDLLEGRDTGSRGHELASLYIANEFKRYGLKPGGENGTFVQRVQFRKGVLEQESPKLSIGQGDNQKQLNFPDDYTVGANLAHANAEVTAPMVFVGYGIVAPELDHDDYANIDVKGKVVVMLTGKPKSFGNEVGSHLSSGRQKANYAADNGAVGLITIQTPASEKRRPFERAKLYTGRPRMGWTKDGVPGNMRPEIEVSAFFSLDGAKMIFENANESLESVFAQLEEEKSPKGFDLNQTISLSYATKHEEISSPNVIGMLEGSDPELKHQYVIYSAHSDHIGMSKSVEKDRINNGAMDNASGTAILLETARLFSKLPVAPKRSILFAAVTGEEKGLLGADYFARNPTRPIEDIIANVNLDMPIITYEFGDVIAFGAKHSTMGKKVEAAAANADIKLTEDPWPHLNLFVRSDHYAFVRQGVPAVFLVTGIESKDPEVDGSKVLGNFLSTNYHRPSDDMSQKFVWKAAATFTRVNFEIGLTLGNDPTRPVWYEDSFFGQTYGR